MPVGQESEVGLVADGDDDRVGGQEIAFRELDALRGDGPRGDGPEELGARRLGMLALLSEGGRLLDVDEGDVRGAETCRLRSRIASDIARADHDDALSDPDEICLAAPAGSRGRSRARSIPGIGQHAGFLGSRGDDDVVVLVAELCEGLAAEVLLEVDRRDQSLDPVDLMTDDLVGDAQAGDGARDLSPQLFAAVEDNGLMPLQVKLPGDREARRSRADDSDLVARGLVPARAVSP